MELRVRIAVDFPSIRHSAENRQFQDLEFFNTIGRKAELPGTVIWRELISQFGSRYCNESVLVLRSDAIAGHLDGLPDSGVRIVSSNEGEDQSTQSVHLSLSANNVWGITWLTVSL
jgi:hypothetical protein